MKKDYTVGIEANKIYKQKLIAKIAKVTFLLLLVIFSIIYFILYILYSKGNFIVSLDKNENNRKNIFLSESGNLDDLTIELQAKSLDYMDNISVNWINPNVDDEGNGSHNGQNYIAYTFYVINYGSEIVNYWYQINLTEVIKNVDKAIRVMVIHNGEKTIYGKKNDKTNKAEEGTEKFYSDTIAVLNEVKDFKPQEKDKFTVVIWIEGDDPDCTNDLIGGEIRMEMNITEEHTS